MLPIYIHLPIYMMNRTTIKIDNTTFLGIKTTMKYSFIFLNMRMQPNCTHEFVYMIRFTFTSAANVYTAMIKTQIHFPFHQQNLTRMLFAYTHLSFLRIFCCCHAHRERTNQTIIHVHIHII